MTIPIYIGTEPSQWLPTQILKHSIVTRTKRDVEFLMLDQMGLPELPMQTGFSFYRWFVPKLNDYCERALYLDGDICVLGDIGDLYEAHTSKPAAARRELTTAGGFFTSVMVLDCDRLRHWDPTAWAAQAATDVGFYARVMWARTNKDVRFKAPNHDDFDPLVSCWNDLDIVKPDTQLVHFTDLGRQPWRWPYHPQAKVFREALVAAITDGFITATDLEREIRARHIREDLLLQL